MQKICETCVHYDAANKQCKIDAPNIVYMTSPTNTCRDHCLPSDSIIRDGVLIFNPFNKEKKDVKR